ncbi:MAG: alpha/beta hydrolase [Clostridiales bacterium]|nr:alpha/beta hydrolase [Clostridiales bacterium]
MKEYRLKRGGSAVRYQDLPGEQPPLVFLHGLGCTSSFEYPAVAAQPPLRGHRAILIDLLGTGYSDRPTDFGYTVEEHAAYLFEMLVSLKLEQIVLFGHSLGGAVAICLAGLLKDRLRQLVLAESNLDPSPAGAMSRRIASQSYEAFLSRGYDDLLARARRGNPLWGATLASWLPEAAWRISSSAARGGTPSWRQQLYDLPKPKSYLFGEKTLPSEDVDVLRSHGIRVEIIPHAGHSMGLDNPAALAETIASIIADCPEET